LILLVLKGIDPPELREPDVIFIGISDPIIGIAPTSDTQEPTNATDLLLNRLYPPSMNGTFPPPVATLDGALDEGIGASGMPDPIGTFEGIAAGANPPDTVGDVGPNHYVQMVNVLFAIFDKEGNRLVDPLPISTLFAGDENCDDGGVGDPIVLHDQFEDRWLLTYLACSGEGPEMICYSCMAVSTSSDPTG
jgi:hypothetical protein